jgi:hypothetical protein
VSRAAGINLTKSLANEYAADRILVNTICIGLVKSAQIARRAKDGDVEAHFRDLGKRVPIGRVAEASEFADLVAFLAWGGPGTSPARPSTSTAACRSRSRPTRRSASAPSRATRAPMHIGVTIPNNWGIADPRQVLAMGPLAEALGYDSVWVMDHLLNSGYIRERLDDRPYYHPLATLSYLAATTRQVRLGTSVLVILGVGAGAMTEEFEALGVPFRQRGALTNESMEIMKELWTSPDPGYRSPRWNLAGFKFAPKPVQRPTIPMWVGGSSPGALKRAATLGDGWHPTGLSPEEFRTGAEEVRKLATAAGGTPTV